jgi:site-specific DNA-adenine methylase
LDGEVVNVFRMLRDRGTELHRALELTPFARDEFRLSYEPTDDPLEQARRTIARSFMGFGSAAATGENSGFRANSNRSGTTPAHDWANLSDAVPLLIERLRGVVIENRDALDLVAHHDAPTTLHYCDPPYVHSTRSGKVRGTVSQGRSTGKAYRHEMDDAGHRRFAEVVRELEGMVVISGYGAICTKTYSAHGSASSALPLLMALASAQRSCGSTKAAATRSNAAAAVCSRSPSDEPRAAPMVHAALGVRGSCGAVFPRPRPRRSGARTVLR